MCFQSLAVTHNKSLINFMQKYFALSPPPLSLGPTAKRRKIRDADFYLTQLKADQMPVAAVTDLPHRMPQ
jgi:hypothetical protein